MEGWPRSLVESGANSPFGKSTLCAGLVLYGLCADGEKGAEVYGAAADRNQGKIIYREVESMVAQSPTLSSHLVPSKTTHRVVYPRTGSFYEVLSKDSKKTGHGINASILVVDELHVVDRVMWNTLTYAKCSRRQPLQIAISTAGNDIDSLGYERYFEDKRMLAGEVEAVAHRLIVIYEADSNEAWEEPGQWRKANPSLGTTISEGSFAEDFDEAKKGSAAVQSNFKQLRLNLWQQSRSSWISIEEWDACRAELPPDDYLRTLTCYGALDLASRLDLTAWVLCFLDGDRYWLKSRFWAPAEADNRRQANNKAHLKPWMDEGLIAATPGSWTDYDQVERDIADDRARYHIVKVAFDPANAGQIAGHLQADGVELVEFRQSHFTYNEPMQEWEKLVAARLLHHDGNKVLRWMMGNVIVHHDGHGRMRPDKGKSQDKIDGVSSGLMALALAINRHKDDDGPSVYETPGSLTL